MAKMCKRGFIRNAFHLCPVRLWQFVVRIGQAMLQTPVVSQQQEPFTVAIQAPGRMKAGCVEEIGERGPAVRVHESREDPIGFIE